ncbi:hypothetical protein BKA22_002732 [Cellulomonas soli]|nr:hypothetical protein [Cellulomonas soli]
MTELSGEEEPREQPFWRIDNSHDSQAVTRVLRQRFPDAFEALDECLDEADPLDIVYPGNPHEYSDVVLEVLVLLAQENADLSHIGRQRLDGVLRQGLARRFGEDPIEARVELAVDLILLRATMTHQS